MDAAALRAEFPVLERLAFLNAGTDGPVPAAAVRAASGALESQLASGRYSPHFDARFALQAELRELYARVLGCAVADVSLQTSTSEGLATVLAGLDLGPGDEIVTSDSEHPGLIGPLLAARAQGATVRPVPLRDVADAVTAKTTLVACSHVSWVTGEFAPAALAELDVPVVLDGAQGAGAVPIDLEALGCAAYAAAGQKWLCGSDGTGLLYVAPGLPRAGARGRAELHQLRGQPRRLRRDPARRRPPLRHRLALARGGGVLARRHPRARPRGVRRRARPRHRPRRRARRPARRARAHGGAARRRRRSSPGRTPTRRPRASGWPPPG